MKNFNDNHNELTVLEAKINLMRDKLHNMLLNNFDPLNDEILAFSKELDELISRYTTLKEKLKDD
ncbi:Spo0E family sporulation regulatory protein-aspartic acid phosphatase [Lutispora thermophila]|uniref:Spo0E like sporulation regulatory protein n=1 Tax=Lutispora thermophila DSM 19022 TaxID=1122184 RepID=A0A1M6AQ28_9FIRM|nr:Spo0E family sporulation regulatory protein-aspartic acid phosphatase [Lutispora thermophila]SHI38313.1 Spo0E like sporulation regulatory protein [Lutispora thermophila DSM 19022]